jgi:hypothetical protein
MGYRLKNRNRPIPNGVTWRDPGTGWQSPAFTSFDQQVQQIQQARIGNPAMTKRYHLSTDLAVITNEVDAGLAQIAFTNGWSDFYVSSAEERSGNAPSPIPPHPQKKSLRSSIANIADGGEILVKWLNSEDEAVPIELAEARAAVCVGCPLNDKGDWLSFFTVPLAGAFRRELERRKGMNLSTTHDANLHVCGACRCVLQLKVHVPFELFWPSMDDESKLALWEHCWIRKEVVEHGLPPVVT